jgi:hypothetical protein
MQMLDQKIAPPRALAEQGAYLRHRLHVELAALRRLLRALAPGSLAHVGRLYWRIHLKTLGFSCLE